MLGVLVSLSVFIAHAKEYPWIPLWAEASLTEDLFRRSTVVAHVRVLKVEKSLSKDIDLEKVVESNMVHPREHVEVVSSIKGYLKKGDTFWFERGRGFESPKDVIRLPIGAEYFVFLKEGTYGKQKGLVLVDNWIAVVPFDSEMENLLVWLAKLEKDSVEK